MPRKTKTDEEVGYLRAFWDEVREMEADFNGAVSIQELPSKRPGVLEIHLSFTQAVGTLDNPLSQAKYKYTFPTALNQTYAASKWVAARALRQVVADMDEDLKRPRRKRG